ncbi:HINT domain-containing protein [Hominimerdicola aceti]|uniref:HINT domain-containing protein n=1 Tax=Hominimerdicola aceti TaxID=2981726 RepID=A0AAE3IKQ8_9FIRM|nr:HINT domain-containing protein [Hominimerdicola aceti]MCU6707002.1 HINT domain-containing protein [Hominimerdicola aceti]
METSPKTVLETYIREVTTLVHLTVNGEEIVTTVDHPFYVNNRGFIKAWICGNYVTVIRY